MLHMFNNNTYTYFRTAYKLMLIIPSCIIQVIEHRVQFNF